MEFYDEYGRKIIILQDETQIEIFISAFDEDLIVYPSDLNEGYLPPIPKTKRRKRRNTNGDCKTRGHEFQR